MDHQTNKGLVEGGNETLPGTWYYNNIEILSMGVFTMLCVIGSIINTLVISAFMRFKLYNSTSNLQLFSLAVDDLGTALLVEPLVITSYLKPQAFLRIPWLCRYFSSALHIFPWGSTISILILSVTRILIVLYPLMYRTYITCKHICITLLLKYIFLISFVTISNFFWETRFSILYRQCFVNYVRRGTVLGLFTEELRDKITLPILHLIGGLIIFGINAVVVFELIKIKLRKIIRDRSRHVMNAGVELTLLVGVYMITTISIPVIFFTDLLGVKLSENRIALFSAIAKFLFYLQPIINPLIYVIRRPEYRFNVKRAATSFPLRRRRHVQGRFYKSIRMIINVNRFIRNIRDSKRERERIPNLQFGYRFGLNTANTVRTTRRRQHSI